MRYAALLLALVLCLSPLTVLASDLWSEEYYRAVDTSRELTQTEQDDLDSLCLTFMKNHQADLAMLALTSDRYEGESLSAHARDYYDRCGFGYGPNHDGFMMIWDTDTDEMVIETIGNAGDLIPADYLEFTAKTAVTYREKYGVYGPFYAVTKLLTNYLEPDSGEEAAEEAAEETEEPEEITDPAARVGPGGDMPEWYPQYPRQFPKYHDETAPRVVDVADIFTDSEEETMEARLQELRQELSRDIVIFTDVSTYGLSREVYAADFYDFNGYGIGEEYEGVCLFVCMDPNDRGWWCCCTGPETRALYTETVANQIDDILYAYMAAGDYGPGVADWIENFRRIYLTGSPYTPDWAMQDKTAFQRTHDGSAPRIVDDAKLLSRSEIDALETHAKEIREKYGVDLVIHTAYNEGNMTKEQFARDFYYFNGYGLGEDYDGILMTVFKRPGYALEDILLTGFGAGQEKLTEAAANRLVSRSESPMESGEYLTAMMGWLDQTEHLLKTGRAPRSPGSWMFTLVLALLAGAVFGGVALGRARANMAAPQLKGEADAYLVKDSLSVRDRGDHYLNSVESRRYDPPEDKSSGGSSGGGSSSYSGSYSGSSGTSHSGSGRNF